MNVNDLRIGTGDWMQTYTGRAVYPIDLIPSDIDILDIAHSLAMQCRYNGHCIQFYSIAEHCCHIASSLMRDFGETELALAGLMHDATEGYVTDIPRPLKPYLSNYKEIEAQADKAIISRFALTMTDDPRVKEYDTRILTDEREQNMRPAEREWTLREPLGVNLKCWDPATAEAKFLEWYHILMNARVVMI